jgi:hypothetical protein
MVRCLIKHREFMGSPSHSVFERLNTQDQELGCLVWFRNGLQTGWLWNQDLIPCRGEKFISSQQRNWLWSPPGLLFIGYQRQFPRGGKAAR